MKDTLPVAEKIFREKLSARSGVERLKMGCSMFDTSKAIIRASFRNQGLPLSGAEYRKNMFLRLYARDFEEKILNKILEHLDKQADR